VTVTEASYYGASELELASGWCSKPVGIGFDPEAKAHLLRCKDRRHCPYCSKLEKMILLDRIDRTFQPLIDSGAEIGWVTLTVQFDGSSENRATINRDFSKYWARFRANFWKRGVKFSYFKMIEFTEKDVKHIHLMTSPALDYFDVQEAWAWATRGSLIIESEAIKDVRRAATYVSKYMTKLTSYQMYNKHERIYSFSQDLPDAVDLDKYDIIETPVTETIVYEHLDGKSYKPEEAKRLHKRHTSIEIKSYIWKNGKPRVRKHKRLKKPWTIFITPGITYEVFQERLERLEKSFEMIDKYRSKDLVKSKEALKSKFKLDRARRLVEDAIDEKLATIAEIFYAEDASIPYVRKRVKRQKIRVARKPLPDA